MQVAKFEGLSPKTEWRNQNPINQKHPGEEAWTKWNGKTIIQIQIIERATPPPQSMPESHSIHRTPSGRVPIDQKYGDIVKYQ